MRFNTFSVAITIVIVFVGIIASITISPWFALFLGISLTPNPPKPEITYGEFPFRLEYEINGETIIIEDTLICEYDGIGADVGRGKYRKWKDRLASGNERVTLLKLNDTIEIYYSPGSAKYYMDDLADYVEFNHEFPNASIIQKVGETTSYRTIHSDQLLEQYNIKLISWDYTQPIKNTFSKKKSGVITISKQ
ncbi:hypothetical protein [Bacillus horti]|uniref:Uncharacterized protein n=1 Tax=Caldalkalibacillus horti TaxID=77523 RepID=A0ABT9W5H7_9BACI|nr:hypothetical protein [Bacillus horti]MDQ0168501.1 hypothetical protein [Bacillus horti]